MDIVFDFESEAPRIELLLPSDRPEIAEALGRIKEAVQSGTKHVAHITVQSVVHITAQSEALLSVPRHGYIEFTSMEEELYVDAEGPYWLYIKKDGRYITALVVGVGLKLIGDITHVVFTIRA